MKKTTKEKKNKLIDWNWILVVSIVAFLLSLLFSFIGETVIPNVHLVISIILLLVFILLGIIFDIVGVAVTVADISTFNSMASKKVKGADLAVRFIKNSNKVSSFLNDVVGDVCGVVSGSTGIAIALQLNAAFNVNLLIVTLLITAIVSTLTIGGKAIGKSFAINKGNEILYGFVRVIHVFYRR